MSGGDVRILGDTVLATVSLDEMRGIVTFTRKNAPMDPAVLRGMLETVRAALPLEERRHYGLLFDMRRAPMGQPEHEAQVVEFAEAFQDGFAAVATVFSTAGGKAQATRARRDGRAVGGEIMSSMENARRYLEAALDDLPPSTTSR